MAINELIEQSVALFLDNESGILEGDFDYSLTDVISAKDYLEEIKKVSVEKIYRCRTVLEIEAAGFTVIDGLLKAFVPSVISEQPSRHDKINYRLLPEDVKTEIGTTEDLYQKIRSLLDFISGLTDSSAMNLYRKITGISLPGRA